MKQNRKKEFFKDEYEIAGFIIDRRTGEHPIKFKVSLKTFVEKVLPEIEKKIK